MDAERSLLRSAALEVLIPQDNSSDLAGLLSSESEAKDIGDSSLLSIERRSLVFVDERIDVVILISIPPCDENVLNSCLARASVRIEAWAQDVASGSGSASTAEPLRDMLCSTTLALTAEPTVLAQESNRSQRATLLLAWKATLSLNRPRVRMLDPAISLFSVLTVTSPQSGSGPEEMLVPFQAMEKNVFSALRIPDIEGGTPYFPASALTKIIPEQTPTPQQHRIEHMSPRVRLVPAVVSRMTYHRAEFHAKTSPSIIGALNVEVIPFVDLQAEFESLEVSMANGIVDDLTKDLLPLKCRSRDLMTFLYRLKQSTKSNLGANPGTTSQLPNFDVLTIRLQLAVTLSPVCRSKVVMDLTTNIDFFQALNPNYGGPGQPMQRPHRPASLPLTSHSGQTQTTLDSSLQPAANPAAFSGVSISFTAPSGAVKVGKPFIWRILVNNRSARSAKLAVYPLPRVARTQSQNVSSNKRHVSRVSMASLRSRDQQRAIDNDSDSNVAQAVVDENVVYALQHSNGPQNQGDIISLTAELRIGGLAPGQCHEGEIEFLALKAGTFQVDTIRIVDVIREAEEGISAPGVMLDLYDLPDIVAEA